MGFRGWDPGRQRIRGAHNLTVLGRDDGATKQRKGKEDLIRGFYGNNVKFVIDMGWGLLRLVDNIDLWSLLSSFRDYKKYQGMNLTIFTKKSDCSQSLSIDISSALCR